MKNHITIWVIFILMFLMAGVVCLIKRDIETISLSSQIVALEAKIVEHTERLENCKEFSLFKQASIKIGSRTWDENDYNCKDFSIDLAEELKKAGIKSSIAIGEGRDHAWILVWVEATTGEFIPAETDLKILEVRDERMTVIY